MYQNFISIFSPFFEICRFRIAPQDLPASKTLLLITLVLYTLVNILTSTLSLSLQMAFLHGIVDVLLLVLITSSIMYIVKLPERNMQTLTAIMGTNIILGVITFPILTWVFWGQQTNADVSFAFFLLLGLVIWNISIYSYIFQHALSTTRFVGLAVVIISSLLSYTILSVIFPNVA
jgi:hypothetical protein